MANRWDVVAYYPHTECGFHRLIDVNICRHPKNIGKSCKYELCPIRIEQNLRKIRD